MALIGMKEMLAKAYNGGYGVGGYDGFDSISIMAAMECGKERNAPVLLICAPAEYGALGAKGVAATARALSEVVGVDACLHLDHSQTFEDVVEAIEGGFNSVMIDASRFPFEENIAITRKTVEYAHARGIPVEAELGAVGRVDDSTTEGAEHAANVYTDPGQAAEFIARTGCDFLAVSIGNAHGLYRSAPKFDFDILTKIRNATSIPLVLHGGSGTPADQLKKAVALGMAKVNVASEIGRTFTTVYIQEALEKKTWWAVAKKKAKDEMKKVINNWIDMLGSEGKA